MDTGLLGVEEMSFRKDEWALGRTSGWSEGG